MRSLAYGSRFKTGALVSGVGIYRYPGGTLSFSELRDLSLSSGGAGGVRSLGGTGRGGGAPGPLRLQLVCGFFAVPVRRGRLSPIWFSRTVAGCLSIAAFPLLCPGNTTPHFCYSRTSAGGFLISCCVSSIAAHATPALAILAIIKVRGMSDCSSCTRPACLAIVADMLKTFKKSVAASRVRFSCYLNHIRPHSLLWGI